MNHDTVCLSSLSYFIPRLKGYKIDLRMVLETNQIIVWVQHLDSGIMGGRYLDWKEIKSCKHPMQASDYLKYEVSKTIEKIDMLYYHP